MQFLTELVSMAFHSSKRTLLPILIFRMVKTSVSTRGCRCLFNIIFWRKYSLFIFLLWKKCHRLSMVSVRYPPSHSVGMGRCLWVSQLKMILMLVTEWGVLVLKLWRNLIQSRWAKSKGGKWLPQAHICQFLTMSFVFPCIVDAPSVPGHVWQHSHL